VFVVSGKTCPRERGHGTGTGCGKNLSPRWGLPLRPFGPPPLEKRGGVKGERIGTGGLRTPAMKLSSLRDLREEARLCRDG
jgi:hypothetical protein